LKGGLPLHSSAISYKNRGFAFVGPSGAGKSTIANLLVSPGQLLNDDFSIILPHRINSYRIYSTPFAKREILIKSVNRSAKLETIYFVKQGINNTIDNLSLKKKFVLLLGQSFIFSLVNYFGNKIFDNGEKIVSKVECKQLSFVNDKTIRPFIFQYAEG
jgi:adenylate kinase family enzyme